VLVIEVCEMSFLYKDRSEYYATHWWWDEHDREYTMYVKWRFWKGHSEIPDEWELLEWEIESIDPPLEGNSVQFNPQDIEKSILSDGAPMADIQEVDYE
jgi:hypothetical protein